MLAAARGGGAATIEQHALWCQVHLPSKVTVQPPKRQPARRAGAGTAASALLRVDQRPRPLVIIARGAFGAGDVAVFVGAAQGHAA